MSSFERLAQHSPWSNKAAVIGGVVIAHIAALWAAMQAPSTLPQAPSITPAVVMAEFISLEPEPTPAPPAPPPPPQPAPRPTPKPPTPKSKPQPAPKPKPAPKPAPKAIADPTPAPNAPIGVLDTPAEAAPQEAPTQAAAATTAPPPATAAASAGSSTSTQPVTTQPSSSAAYLNNPRPSYPSISRRMGEQGKVMLRVLVGADGLPQQVELHTSSGYDRLDKAAIAAVQRWQFVPGTRNGTPEAMWNRVPVNFVLE